MESILKFLYELWSYIVSLLLPDFIEKNCPDRTGAKDLPSFKYFLSRKFFY